MADATVAAMAVAAATIVIAGATGIVGEETGPEIGTPAPVATHPRGAGTTAAVPLDSALSEVLGPVKTHGLHRATLVRT